MLYGPVQKINHGPTQLERCYQEDGAIVWRRLSDMAIHRQASEPGGSPGPAVQLSQGIKWSYRDLEKVVGPAEIWMKDGLLHREASEPGGSPGPAFVGSGVVKLMTRGGGIIGFQIPGPVELWAQHGKLHREASEPGGSPGPAVIKRGGRDCEWWVNGNLHREAIEPGGSPEPARISRALSEYYHHGKRHRLNGPAVIVNKGFSFTDPRLPREIEGPAEIYFEDDRLYRAGLDIEGRPLPAIVVQGEAPYWLSAY
jgi:hypothetical protein